MRGDIVVLAEGDRVPADAILLSCTDLEADESLLTGESVPARKRAWMPPVAESISTKLVEDKAALAFAGTMIVRGHAVGEVFATGAASEIGKIGKALGEIVIEPSLLHLQVRRLVRALAVIGIGLSVLVVILYVLMRGSWLDGLLAGITLAMSLLPEEFPLVLTIFLVMGAWRISKAHVLTRRSATIETLGAATVLCSDKTGTLTVNRMSIAELFAAGETFLVHPQATARFPKNSCSLSSMVYLLARHTPSIRWNAPSTTSASKVSRAGATARGLEPDPRVCLEPATSRRDPRLEAGRAGGVHRCGKRRSGGNRAVVPSGR